MALGLTITSTGRDDLALAIAQSDSLTIQNIVLTNAQTTGTLADVESLSDLGGSSVATMAASGKLVDNGKVQIEGSDGSTASYEAKTLALTYTKSGATKVFALYTSSSTFIYKVSDTAVMIAAAITIEASQASSITFNNVTLQFPAATTSANGAVKLGTESQLDETPAVDANHPLVPTVQTMATVLKRMFGENVPYGSTIDLKSVLYVGRNANDTTTIASSSFTLDSGTGYYQANWPYASFNVDDFKFGDSYWKIGSTVGGFAFLNVIDLYTAVCLVSESGTMAGLIMRVDNVFKVRMINQPTSNVEFHLSTAGVTRSRNVESYTSKSNVVEGNTVKSGGSKQLGFSSSDFYLTDTAGLYRYNDSIFIDMNGGREVFTLALEMRAYSQEQGYYYELVQGSLSGYDKSWTYNGRTYKYSYNTNTFTCTGGTPEIGRLTFNERGNIESGGDVKAYGVSLANCGSLGYYAGTLSKGTSASYSTLTRQGYYNVSATMYTTKTLHIEYSGTKLRRDGLFAEIICNEKIFDSNTNSTKIVVLSAAGGIDISNVNLPGSAALSNIPILIKIY